jgi:hypothetical protein
MSRLLKVATVVGALSLSVVVGPACKRDNSSGLPPATEWQTAKDPAPEPVAADPGQANPHGNGMSNPHANVPGMGDPSGTNPHGNGPMAEKTDPRTLQKLPDGRLLLGPFAFKLPDGWTPKPVTSTMRVADLQMAPDADMIVYYFGEGGAGSVQDNVSRWLGQITPPDGKTSKDVAKIETIKVAGQDATVVSVAGKYGAESMMPNQGATNIDDAEMFAAIISSPQGPFTFKGVGPRATMEANAAKWKAMLASFELHDGAAPPAGGW